MNKDGERYLKKKEKKMEKKASRWGGGEGQVAETYGRRPCNIQSVNWKKSS